MIAETCFCFEGMNVELFWIIKRPEDQRNNSLARKAKIEIKKRQAVQALVLVMCYTLNLIGRFN